MAWAQVPIAAFSYTAGTPTVFVSSESGERRFCAHCGGQVEFRRRPDPKTVEFYLATLDDPSQVVPQVHIFTKSRIPWFDTADQLPRLQEMG